MSVWYGYEDEDNEKTKKIEIPHIPAEVTFKYYLPEHNSEVFIHTNANIMYNLLWEIDQQCRSKLKYGNQEDWPQFVADLRHMIDASINLYLE